VAAAASFSVHLSKSVTPPSPPWRRRTSMSSNSCHTSQHQHSMYGWKVGGYHTLSGCQFPSISSFFPSRCPVIICPYHCFTHSLSASVPLPFKSRRFPCAPGWSLAANDKLGAPLKLKKLDVPRFSKVGMDASHRSHRVVVPMIPSTNSITMKLVEVC